jgi:hypothetical protein
MQRSCIYDLLQAATFSLPFGHPVVDALNRALSSDLLGDMVRAKDAVAALQNHDPESAAQLAFAYRTLAKGRRQREARSTLA